MKTIVSMYQETFRSCYDDLALQDYFTKKKYTYGDFAGQVAKYHILFNSIGIQKGDKIALIGRNTSGWAIGYIATITYGAVIVPILPEFNPIDIQNIVDHSDSKLILADGVNWRNLCQCRFENSKGVVDIDNYEYLSGDADILFGIDSLKKRFSKTYPDGFHKEDIKYEPVPENNVIVISYTSGTTGVSKGVMLTARNITSNVQFALDHKFHFHNSRVLGILPLAHTYGCTFDMLTPLAAGSSITLLGKTPSPALLIKALQSVKPHLICTVPLVMEKIVRKQIFPMMEGKKLKTLLRIPPFRQIIFRIIRSKMLKSFGGSIKEINIGGAALASDVEQFLRSIRFPFTIGYGMTECGPLISYERWNLTKAGSCGRILPNMEVRILYDNSSSTSEGEILVRGSNVMKGYYKNPQATAEAIDNEGWLHTGDIGIVDSKGFIFLKGRCKSMILSANGQNIYPEGIEAKLNELPYILESLVYDDNGKLNALVFPDKDKAKEDNVNLEAIMQSNLDELNSKVSNYEKIGKIILCSEEFKKTPKRSIRRYLYPAAAKMLVI